jgi:hypothetical protein
MKLHLDAHSTTSCVRACVLVLCSWAGAEAARAALSTSGGDTFPPTLVAGFDNLGEPASGSGRVPVLDLPGIALGVQAVNGPLRSGSSASDWKLGSNGQWTSARSFVGVDAGADTVTNIYAAVVFDFGSLTVNRVGAIVNFNPDYAYGAGFALPLYVAAYDVRGQLLESYEVEPRTRGATNQGTYYGISTAGWTINRFEVSGPYAVVDNLTFTTPIPDAPAGVLAWTGLLVLALARRGLMGQR